MEQTVAAGGILIDKTDLHILIILSANCRSSYRTIASTVGISTNAVKVRVKNLLDKGIIQRFIAVVNPAVFGYEKQCLLILRNSDKIIAEQKQKQKQQKEEEEEEYIFNQLSLFGDIWIYAQQLGGAAIFLILLRPGDEDKSELMNNLLKPAITEFKFVMMKPPSINVSISDLKIIKCLLSNARMEIAEIAKEVSISRKTAGKRLEKMQQHHLLNFSIIRDMSSMNLAGLTEFLLMVDINNSDYIEITERIYREMQEYLISIPPNIYSDSTTGSDAIIALFICSNIPTVNLIARRIKSYDGVQGVQSFITTNVSYHQEWLEKHINKTLRSHSKTAQTVIRLPDSK
jgi:DNA-binding Lrp family transcriptional regulator